VAVPKGAPIDWSDLGSETRETAIQRLIYRTKMSRAEAEDAVASAVVRLMRLRPTVRDPRELLVIAALNEFRRDWRRLASRGNRLALAHSLDDPEHVAVVKSLPDDKPDPSAEVSDGEEQTVRNEQLRAALERLSPLERSLLTAYYFEGRSPQQIDQERGDKPGTAQCRIHRARGRLRSILRAADYAPGRSP
jgi:RNA polymerase sigma factor (sigma-70 family)